MHRLCMDSRVIRHIGSVGVRHAGPSVEQRLVQVVRLVLVAFLLVGCSSPTDEGKKSTAASDRATHPQVNSLKMAGHILAIQATAASGDMQSSRAHQEAMRRQIQESMRIPDASRPIDPEAARVAVATLQGVRGVVWIDRSNLVVMVDGARYRSTQMIDRVCAKLKPLGDTLAVVVNLQNVNAVHAAEADTLSRNCMLPMGERAFAQPNRQIDALDPALRKVFEAQQSGNRKQQ